MRVVSISESDPACQSYLLAKALARRGWDAVDVRMNSNYLGYPSTFSLDSLSLEDAARLRRELEEADFYVVHGYDPALLSPPYVQPRLRVYLSKDDHVDVRLRPGNHVFKLHGTDAVTYGRLIRRHVERHGSLFVGSPDPRIWRSAPCIQWIPPMMDKALMNEVMNEHDELYVKDLEIRKEEQGSIWVNHCATDRRTKRTDVLSEAAGILREKGVKVYVDIVQGATWAESLWHQSVCDVYFDQVFAGMYGVSAVQALMLGKPVIVGLNGYVKSWLYGRGALFVTANDAETVANQIHAVTEDLIVDTYARKAKEWAERVHGLATVGEQWRHVIEEAARR